jgi:hypothetical protein
MYSAYVCPIAASNLGSENSRSMLLSATAWPLSVCLTTPPLLFRSILRFRFQSSLSSLRHGISPSDARRKYGSIFARTFCSRGSSPVCLKYCIWPVVKAFPLGSLSRCGVGACWPGTCRHPLSFSIRLKAASVRPQSFHVSQAVP